MGLQSGLRRAVGFIGLGAMGSPMARNLVTAGFPLVVYDMDPKAVEPFAPLGAMIASSPKDLANDSRVIITILPSSSSLREVLYGKDGLLPVLGSQHTFIEMSTLDVATTLEFSNEIQARGARFLDCPVSGTPEIVERRDAEILSSGDQVALKECSDILSALSKRVVYAGKVGNGKAMKLCTNLLIGLNKLALAESITLALKLGLEPDVILECINGSNARSAVSERYGLATITGKEKISKKHSWQRKDLSLVVETAKQNSTRLVLGELAKKITEEASISVGGSDDYESIRRYYRNLMKLD